MPPWVRSFEAGGYPLGCFADDFQITEHGVLGLPIRQEAVLSARCLFHDLPDGISNVEQIDVVILHRETASA